MTVSALPHAEPEEMQTGLEEMRAERSGYNVAMMHAGVVGLGVFRMNEFNERLVKSSYLKSEFDYIALGHYHELAEVGPRACYSGSTERFSFMEAGQDKGFLVVDLGSGKRGFERLRVREMLDLGPIDASRKDPVELQEEIEALLDAELAGKIVRLRVRDIPASTYGSLDFGRIGELVKEAVHFERKFEVRQEGAPSQLKDTSLASIQREFRSYLMGYPVEGVDKEGLLERGLGYIERRLEGSG